MKKIMHTRDIVLMNVAAIIGLRWLPIAAGYGASSLVLWIIAAVMFLIPLGLVSSELATAWPEEGGIYVWVREAYGEKLGFLISWFYWTNSFFYFPSLLIFIAVTMAFVINPALATNKIYVCSTVLVTLWVITILNFRGTRVLKYLSNLGGVIGTIIPGLVIVALGFGAVFFWHRPIPTDYSWSSLWPNFGADSNIVFLSTLMFSMAGIELTPTLAGETHNPKKTFPRALLISAILIVLIYIVGTLAITFMISPSEIGSASGIMDALKLITQELHLPLVLPLIAIMILLSSFSGVSVWAVVPIKMLYTSCKGGVLPHSFTKLNKYEMPRNALLIQSIIVTIIILGTSLLPTVNSFYEILILMATITYFIPYVLMFMTFLKLRSKYPHQERPYKVPGGKIFAWIVTIVGLFSVLLAILLPFIVPPKDLHTTTDILLYRLEIAAGPVIFAVLGYWIYARYEKRQLIIKNENRIED